MHTAPRIGGAVVLAEHADLIREASGNVTVHKMEQAEAKWEKKISDRWALLTRGLISRKRLKEKYGH
jgi:hypothetical protein